MLISQVTTNVTRRTAGLSRLSASILAVIVPQADTFFLSYCFPFTFCVRKFLTVRSGGTKETVCYVLFAIQSALKAQSYHTSPLSGKNLGTLLFSRHVLIMRVHASNGH